MPVSTRDDAKPGRFDSDNSRALSCGFCHTRSVDGPDISHQAVFLVPRRPDEWRCRKRAPFDVPYIGLAPLCTGLGSLETRLTSEPNDRHGGYDLNGTPSASPNEKRRASDRTDSGDRVAGHWVVRSQAESVARVGRDGMVVSDIFRAASDRRLPEAMDGRVINAHRGLLGLRHCQKSEFPGDSNPVVPAAPLVVSPRRASLANLGFREDASVSPKHHFPSRIVLVPGTMTPRCALGRYASLLAL